MIIKTVFIRFYKSFNFDYLRKYHGRSKPLEWEWLDGMWYPFVQVSIEPDVTTVVGANESGKSHLLSAIEKGLTGDRISREDFCRYSHFFTVEKGKMRLPDFGFEFSTSTSDEETAVRALCEIDAKKRVDRFFLFRTEGNKLTLYLPGDEKPTHFEIPTSAQDTFLSLLPRAFRIDANVALPESVPLRLLTTSESKQYDTITALSRGGRIDFLTSILNHQGWYTTSEAIKKHSDNIAQIWSGYLSPSQGATRRGSANASAAELNLARKLLFKVANIDPAAIDDLYTALINEREGYVQGIINRINDSLATNLNFPRWWMQDRHFKLIVAPREHDLVFTIRDRTNTEYAFEERSGGLKYFLSYYVQYLAHEERIDGNEVLLMDEPDAYLSSQGQQDLLKILNAYAHPENERKPLQVVYVTHSPFLIDKNHGERIRVLEKGTSDEGTRVVRDVARNHYEPLRSAFGAFVGETTFIGKCNLMVEGLSDQIILAGMAIYLRSLGTSNLETLDLNDINIVPAGSSSHIPYLVYLARGRDVEKPAVIALLDSDSAGNQAATDLRKGGPKRKQLLKPDYILQVANVAQEAKDRGLLTSHNALGIEDLVPISLCTEAANLYAHEMSGGSTPSITESELSTKLSEGKAVIEALNTLYAKTNGERLHIEKVAFARSIIRVVSELEQRPESDANDLQTAVKEFVEVMRILFRRLGTMQRDANRELGKERVTDRIERTKQSFLADHSSKASREQALLLLEALDAALDESQESDYIRVELQKLRRDFELDRDLTTPIVDYAEFKRRVTRLEYVPRLMSQDDSESSVPTKELPPAVEMSRTESPHPQENQSIPT